MQNFKVKRMNKYRNNKISKLKERINTSIMSSQYLEFNLAEIEVKTK